MSLNLKKLVRDRLVNDSTMRGLLNASATGSAAVSPTFMERSGVYAQIIYSETFGNTDPGMGVENGLITFNVEVLGSSGANPHTTYENICDRIRVLFDDQSIQGTGVSGTGSYSFLFLREGGPSVIFDNARKVYQQIVSYSYKAIQG